MTQEEIDQIARERAAARDALRCLTGRQRQIVEMAARGLMVADIATALCRTIHTIHSHRKDLLARTGLTMPEIIVLAAKAGWV